MAWGGGGHCGFDTACEKRLDSTKVTKKYIIMENVGVKNVVRQGKPLAAVWQDYQPKP